MAAATVTEVRAGFNPQQWKAWRKPCDKSNPAQLKRIVREWSEQKEILATLLTIDSNPSRALGMLLASHQLMQGASVTITAVPPAVVSESEPEDTTDFEDNTDNF